MAAVEIVPLTHEHLTAFYGEAGRQPSVKGVACLVDGDVAGIGGLAYLGGKVLAFCELKEAARPFKTAIHRSAVRLLAEARQRHRMIVAECDEREERAREWLSRLGFTEGSGGRWIWLA